MLAIIINVISLVVVIILTILFLIRRPSDSSIANPITFNATGFVATPDNSNYLGSNDVGYLDIENRFVPIERVHSSTGRDLIRFVDGGCLTIGANRALTSDTCDPMNNAQQVRISDLDNYQQMMLNGGRCLAHGNNQRPTVLNMQTCLKPGATINRRDIMENKTLWKIVT